MKRLRIIGIIFAILFVAALVFLLVQPKEPSFRGRTLSAWLVDAVPQINDMTNYRYAAFRQATANRAIKEIGTNAIPWLLKWMQATPSPLKDRLNLLLDKQHVIQFRFEKFEWKQSKALYGFEILGGDALPAVPALLRLMQSPDASLRDRALDGLIDIDQGKKLLLPELRQFLNDSDPVTQIRTATYLHSWYPELSSNAGAANIPAGAAISTNRPAVK
jgi:hypothetical protein